MIRLFLFLILITLFSLQNLHAQNMESTPTADQEADFVVEWMRLIYSRIDEQGINVPTAARVYAYTGVTLYQAVAPGIPNAIPLAEMLNEMPDMPLPESGVVYDWASVANGALAVVVEGLMADANETNAFNTAPSNGTLRAIDALRQQQATERRQEVGSEVVERSLRYGAQLGETILTWAADDHYATTREMTYTMPTGDEALWVVTTPGEDAMEPHWGLLRPFVLPSVDHCAVPLDVGFDTDLDSTFHLQAMEIRDMQANLTEDQQQMATFWDERPGESGTAAGHWLDVENQLVGYLDLNLEEAATMYALVGVAFHDSFVSTWSLKYQINLLRPETYINTYIDPNWEPYRQTPPFPAYPSGHSVLGGAVAEVLTALWGPIAYTDRYGVQYGLRARTYTSFKAAAYENALSRMYAGVHYRVDIENGLEQGQCIGQMVIDKLMTEEE